MTHGQNKDRKAPNAETIGGRIRKARESKRISIRRLAEAVGMHHSYVARLEADELRQPSPEKLQRVADFLGIDHGDLFALAGYRAPGQLPGFMPYLRAKYKMSESTARQLSEHFEQLKRERRIVERLIPMPRVAADDAFSPAESVAWEEL